MTHARKVDVNQGDIVKALRKAGFSVLSLSGVKGGCPDLLVGGRIPGGRHGIECNILLEVKSPKREGHKQLTPDQEHFHRAWKGPIFIVRSVDEALLAVGL